MALQAAQMNDLLKATLEDLGKPKVTDLTTDTQMHFAYRNLMAKNRVVIDSGTSIEWRVRTGTQSNFQFTGLYGTDNINVSENLTVAEVPWRHATTGYAVDERELAMNREPARIVDEITGRRYECMVEQAEELEDAFWRVPSASNDVNPFGIPYYVVKSSTANTTNNGFNGGHPSGYSDVAGIARTGGSAVARWLNWASPYTAITKDDLIRAWRKGAHYTKFIPPVAAPPSPNTGDDYGWYTNYTVRSAVVEILEAQNDNLGTDCAAMEGDVMFMRRPINWVPTLDADTTGVVYGINWGVMKLYILRGYWMREVRIEITPGQHTVATVFMDTSLQLVCKDPRRQMVLSTGTTMPS